MNRLSSKENKKWSLSLAKKINSFPFFDRIILKLNDSSLVPVSLNDCKLHVSREELYVINKKNQILFYGRLCALASIMAFQKKISEIKTVNYLSLSTKNVVFHCFEFDKLDALYLGRYYANDFVYDINLFFDYLKDKEKLNELIK